jgi:glycosyltransferase involved in cell wall biosynthesis
LRNVLGTPLRRLLSQGASANVAITDHVKGRLELQRTETIYYGLGHVEGEDSAALQKAETRKGDIRFGYVGRLVAEKGLELLVQAAGLLRDRGMAFHVAFIGDGDCRSELEDLVHDNGLENAVTFTGFLSGAQLEQAVEGIDVVVMPSRWEETAGLSAMEQMRRARLVIAANIGGLGEVVGEAGLRFRPGSAIELAQAMTRVCNEPALIDEFGARALTRSRKLFTRDRMVSRQLGSYRRILSLQP